MRWTHRGARLGLALVLWSFVVSMGAVAEAKPEFVLKFGSVAPTGTPWAVQLEALKKRIEKESKGRIKVKMFLGGVLGGEVEMVRAVRRGRLQGWGGSTAALAEAVRIPQFQLMELPFLFKNNKEADYVLDKVLQDDFKAILSDKAFVFGFWHENGWRNFASKKTPIRSLKDLKGLKMRAQESQVHLAMYKALGAQAEAIPVPELIGALKTGMVDGFDNTLLLTSATGWYEGIKYYTISNHIYQPAIILYSKRFMDKLPADLRKVVLGDPRKEAVEGRKAVRGMRGQLIKHFKDSGIQIIELSAAEREKFQRKCETVHKQMEGKVGRALLGKARKALAKLRAGK